jgi:hypothetical protein
LTRFTLEWAVSKILDWGKCLGFILGPTGGRRMRLKAEGKWLSRSSTLAWSESAARPVAHLHNTRCFPALGYVAQLVPPPRSMIKAERKILQRLYHNNSFPPNLSRHFKGVLKLSQPSSIMALCIGTCFRTAVRTVPKWQHLYDAAPWNHYFHTSRF